MPKNGKSRKEFRLDVGNSNFKVSGGTLDKANPSVVYLKFDTWVRYSGESKLYKENVEILNSNVRNRLKSILRTNAMFDASFLYTPEIKKSFFSKRSNFHACFEFTLKQRDPVSTDLVKIENELEVLSSSMTKAIESSVYFRFSISKEAVS